MLSVFLPGLGQIYQGHILAGVVFFILVLGGYGYHLLLGVLLHVGCIAHAYSLGTQGKAKRPTSGAFGCPSCAKTVWVGDATCKHCGLTL